MGFLVTAACGLVGNFLLLRRMALIGDAVSHSILFGIVISFLIFRELSTSLMFLGAVFAAILTVILTEVIKRFSRVKSDAAICIVFTTLFALGVALLSLAEQGGGMHIDAECVLYGEIAFVPLEPLFIFFGVETAPPSVLRMAVVLSGVLIIISVFYKELLLTSFDINLARTLGISSAFWHYVLMLLLVLVVVSAFESVGAILAVAMLIVPGMFAAQLSDKLPIRLLLTCLHAFLSSLLGYILSVWLLCSTAGAMAVVAALLFVAVWIFTARGSSVVRLQQVRER